MSEVVVAGVVKSSVGLAGGLANWVNSWNERAVLETFSSDVVSAGWHSVVEAEFVLTERTARNNTLSHEPGPWSGDLTTIASERHTLGAIAASSGVSDGKESLELAA